MNIIRTHGELTNKDKYDMIISGMTEKMKDARDIIQIDKYIIGEDVNEKGETVKVLAVKDVDGNVYGTISATFIEDFEKCADNFDDEFKAFSVKILESKGGREYIRCVYEDC